MEGTASLDCFFTGVFNLLVEAEERTRFVLAGWAAGSAAATFALTTRLRGATLFVGVAEAKLGSGRAFGLVVVFDGTRFAALVRVRLGGAFAFLGFFDFIPWVWDELPRTRRD